MLSSSRATLRLLIAGLAVASTSGFYIPGVAPTEYTDGTPLDVKAVKMTSIRHPLPYEYYFLPFCQPAKLEHRAENLGEVLRGDRITNTPYEISMGQNITCRVLCSEGGSPGKEYDAEDIKKFGLFIANEYRAHWLLDNLPSATKLKVDERVTYLHGFPIGFIDTTGGQHMFNHYVLVIKTHQVVEGSHRIVGFEVKAGSFATDTYKVEPDGTCSITTEKRADGTVATPRPLILTTPTNGKKQRVIWSYGVHFEKSDIAWASRWDTYLQMADVKIHWFSIINSFITVIFLSAILGLIIVRTLSRDIARYNSEEEDEMESTGPSNRIFLISRPFLFVFTILVNNMLDCDACFTLLVHGWKNIHGDIFRAPAHPEAFVGVLATGIQLIGAFCVTLGFALLGMLSPSSRGALMTICIVAWLLMGLLSGYYALRIYKSLGGTDWKKTSLIAATLFPSILFGTGFIINFFIWGKHSSGAVPFTTMLILVFMWFGISVPLVLAGGFFGFRKEPYLFPVGTNQIHRQIPEQPSFLNPAVSMLLGGILPFGAIFIELFFIMTAIWENQFYYLFGFLFLVFVVLVIVCSEIAIVMTYMQLCAEDYNWWWRSVIVSGGCAIYVWLYCAFYFVTKLEVEDAIATFMFFGYSTVMALGFFFSTGSIGFVATFAFVRKIYGAVKID